MAKKFVKRTDANNETLYFYTHSDVVDVGEGNATTSLTNALNNKANTSDVQALSDDALRKSPQSLSNQEKEQVHNNIGTESFVDDRAVRYDDAQVLGSEEKTQALTNLGLNGVDDEPTPNSDNLVKSGGVLNAIDSILNDVSYTVTNRALLADGTFGTNTTYKHAAIEVNAGEKYIITNMQDLSGQDSYTRYAFATSKSIPDADPVDGKRHVPFVEGYESVVAVPVGRWDIVVIPEGCTYLLVNYGETYPLHVKNYQFIDDEPIYNSNKLVKSGGVYRKINPSIAITPNIFLRYNGATGTTNNAFGVSDYYYITEGISIVNSRASDAPTSDYTFLCFYDINKNFISRLRRDTASTKATTYIVQASDIPENAIYFRATVLINSDTTSIDIPIGAIPSVIDNEIHLREEDADEEPLEGSDKLIKSSGVADVNGCTKESAQYLRVVLDKENNLLYAVEKNGNFFFGKGVPQQVVDFLGGSIEGRLGYYQNNKEFLWAIIDDNQNILLGIRKDGTMIGGIDNEEIVGQINALKTELQGNSIDALYNNKEYLATVQALVHKITNGRDDEYSRIDNTKTQPLALLHFSDSHGSDNIGRCMEYYNIFKPYIDDVLNTGDTVRDYYEDGIAPFLGVEGHEKILNVIGNHDTRKKNSEYDDNRSWAEHAGKDAYDTFIAPFVSNWSVVQPEYAESAGKCYYYKDYTDKEIRLIVLDNMAMTTISDNYDAGQYTWFMNVLNGAYDNDLTVVIAMHFPNDGGVYNCPFTQYNQSAGSGDWSATEIQKYFMAIDVFKSRGGKFVCYLAGHKHGSVLGWAKSNGPEHPDGYKDQLIVSVGSTILDSRGHWSRTNASKSRDFFHLVCIDTYRKLLKIKQVGVEYDDVMRHRDSFSYNYETNEFIELDIKQ